MYLRTAPFTKHHRLTTGTDSVSNRDLADCQLAALLNSARMSKAKMYDIFPFLTLWMIYDTLALGSTMCH